MITQMNASITKVILFIVIFF